MTQGDPAAKTENSLDLAHYFSKGVHINKKIFPMQKSTFGPQGGAMAAVASLGYASGGDWLYMKGFEVTALIYFV